MKCVEQVLLAQYGCWMELQQQPEEEYCMRKKVQLRPNEVVDSTMKNQCILTERKFSAKDFRQVIGTCFTTLLTTFRISNKKMSHHCKSVLIFSGLLEICFAILLGWYLAASIAFKPKVIPPFNSFKRVLQAHIDYILMGILQIIVGLVVGGMQNPLSNTVLYMLIFGSWANASSFLAIAISESFVRTTGGQIFSVISFLTLTIAYPAIAHQYYQESFL